MNTDRLKLEKLSVGYNGRTVIDNIDLSAAGGTCIALVGPNASGKTTLLRAIAGRLAPTGGSIYIDGRQVCVAKPGRGNLPGFALPPDELPGFLTVRQCLDIYADAHGFAAVPEAQRDLALAMGLMSHADTLVRNTSLGTRQKLAVVLALMMQPSVLLLDEVFSGLDFASAMVLREHLRELVRYGTTILLATHSLDTALRCGDELVLLDTGRLAGRWELGRFAGAGGPGELERELAGATKQA